MECAGYGSTHDFLAQAVTPTICILFINLFVSRMPIFYYCSHTSTRIERRVCIVMRNKKLYYIAVVGKKQVLKLKDSAWSIKQFCFHEKHFEGDSNLSKDKFLSYTHEKLKSVPTNNFATCFDVSNMGSWYLKGYNGHIFIVVTSHGYDKLVAIECLDDLCDTYLKSCRIWDTEKRLLAQNECCNAIAESYATFEEGGLPHFLVSSIDEEVSLAYSNSIQEVLVENIEKAKSKVHKNMLLHIQNMESADELDKKAAKALENAKAFKKNAIELKKRIKKRNYVPLIVFTSIGAAVGFFAGGPGGAAVLTKLGSVAGAQFIEAGVVAAVFGVGFLGTESVIDSWTMNQKIVHI